MEKLETTDYNKWYVPAEGNIVAGCIDGRCGCKNHYPNSAGGSLSLYIAARLCGYEIDQDQFYANLAGMSCPLGAHTDEHNAENPDKTGCGANDLLDEILREIAGAESRAVILERMEKYLGEAPEKRVADQIGEIAANFTLSTPRERLNAIVSAGGSVDELEGGHEEEEIWINFVPNTTLDRNQSQGKIFNVDAWSFVDSARAALSAIGITEPPTEQIDQFVAALTIFNFATAEVLKLKDNPTTKIVVLRPQPKLPDPVSYRPAA
jgi:hypothetical protein